jgi:hypothetical protein
MSQTAAVLVKKTGSIIFKDVTYYNSRVFNHRGYLDSGGRVVRES